MGGKQTRVGDVTYHYAVPVNTTEQPESESFVYRHPAAKTNLVRTLPGETQIRTVHDAYIRSFQKFPDFDFIGTRQTNANGTIGSYRFKTYKQVQDLSTKLGSGLLNLNLVTPIKEYQDIDVSFVLIWSKNREEWLISDIACCLYNLTMVPVHHTLGPEAVNFIFDQTKASTVLVANEHIANVIAVAPQCPTLRTVVAFEAVTPEQVTKAKEAGLDLITYSDVYKSGGAQTLPYRKPQPDDLYTINYTSGTTGQPKGVMLTHANQVAGSSALVSRDDFRLTPDDVYLSYLPLAHVLEKRAILAMGMSGCSVGFYQGNPQKLKDDMQELKPTIFFSVPRLYNRFYEEMQNDLNARTGVKKSLAQKAVRVKLNNLAKTGKLTHKFYDNLVFKKIRQSLGGKIRLMLTASAPIETGVQNFLRIALSSPFVEAYGQTETCGSSFMSHANIPSFGHVGGPLSCVEFKVVDVAEMNYTSKDVNCAGLSAPRGEICVRGPTIFRGYYKDAEKTAETIDNNGWVHTGDIGRINPDGSLNIIDRKKNIFKLAQGEYVTTEKVENAYLNSKYVSEAFLYGDSYKSYCVSVIVPRKESLLELGKELNLANLTYEQLCQNKDVVAKVLADMTKKGKENKVNTFELAQQLYLESSSFAAKDLLTPSFKLIRHKAKLCYENVIADLYHLPVARSH